MKTSSWSLETSAVSVELKRFIAEKCAQVRAESRAAEHPMSPESESLFAAAEQGDWRGVFDSLAAMHKGMQEGESARSRSWAVYPVEWAAVNEIGAALGQFAAGDEQYAIAFAQDIIGSIPPGSIYFGGTDPGRFLVTALSRSHVNGDPFFTLTQNFLANSRSYLRYLRGMYGSRIYIPTEEDVARSLQEYQEDARRRRSEGKLLPGEDFEEVGGKLEIRGQVGVMVVNGLLSKLIFERNPEREFYVEQSFPLDWMYPHLTPHNLILKINRQPLSGIPAELVQQDHDHWTRYIRPMIGTWLSADSSVAEIVSFVEKVYVQKDLGGFTGDPVYVQNDLVQRMFSKLRSSIGGLYAWRAQNSQSAAEKERMLREADFAFRQAFVLCPASPEVVFRYISLSVPQKRLADAILVAETAVKLEETPKPMAESSAQPLTPLVNLLEQLKKLQQGTNG